MRCAKIRKNLYKYNKVKNFYICPQEKELIYKGINRAGMLIYITSKKDCENCDFKARCTNQNFKEIQRHLYEEAKKFVKRNKTKRIWKRTSIHLEKVQ